MAVIARQRFCKCVGMIYKFTESCILSRVWGRFPNRHASLSSQLTTSDRITEYLVVDVEFG
jgi:hypothetical protein